MKNTILTRRDFLKTSTAAGLAFAVVPRYVLAGSGQTSPNERLNIAGIGVGGMGAGDIRAVAEGNNIVALCDVDARRAGGTFEKFPDVKRYQDFRKMFDAMERSIDAVVVATPDHCHAVAAMAAIRRGKHVYCEKPLAHSVYEVRALMKAATEVAAARMKARRLRLVEDFDIVLFQGLFICFASLQPCRTACDRALDAPVRQLQPVPL